MSLPLSVEDGSVDLGPIVFTGLLALGYNPYSVEQKEQVPINEHIFKRMNQKVGDHMLHFLFTRINPQHAAKVFRDCWPIYDKKIEAQFRNAAFEWFKLLNQSDKFNLKPCLVVSKSVVMPINRKFLSTLYTLCRIALHTQIMQKDPSCRLIFHPSLAVKSDQKRKCMPVMNAFKVDHVRRYISSVEGRNNALKALAGKAKNLCDKYRSVLRDEEETIEGVKEALCSSPFLTREKDLSSDTFESFKEDMETRLSVKNDEISSLWSVSGSLKEEDDRCWPGFEYILRQGHLPTTVSGREFELVKANAKHLPFIQGEDRPLFDVEGNVDLVGLVVHLNRGLTHLIDSAGLSKGPSGEAELSACATHSRCVSSLHDDTRDIKRVLDEVIPELCCSVSQLRDKLEERNGFRGGDDRTKDLFELCPPTPVLNLEETRERKLGSPFTLIQLTPACHDRSNFIDEDSMMSDLPMPCRSGQAAKIRSKHKNTFNGCGSPALKRGEMAGAEASPILSRRDSGCVMSNGRASLLQPLLRLETTPKRGSPLYLSTKKDIDDTLSPTTNATLDHVTGDGVLDCNGSNVTLGCDASYDGGIVHRCQDGCEDVAKMAQQMVATPKHQISQSNIVADLIKQIDKDENSVCAESKFMNFAKRWSNVKEEMKKNINKSLSHQSNTLSQISNSSFSHSLLNNSFLSLSTTLKSTSTHTSPTSLSTTSPPTTSNNLNDATKMFNSYKTCMSSLESRLEVDEKEESHFQFLDVHKGTQAFPNQTKDCLETNTCFGTDDDFVDGVGLRFERESTLPKTSLFETLTESLVSGETEAKMMLDDRVEKEVRRESSSVCKRDSIIKPGRRNEFDTPRLSLGRNIFDESDSCLSTSSDIM